MKQAIIGFVLAVLVSGGATTAFLVHRAGPPVATAPTADAPGDSSGAVPPKDAAHGAGVADTADTTRADSTAGSDATHGEPAPSGSASHRPDPLPSSREAVPSVDRTAQAAAYKQVARVLSAMKAAEAAKVLGYMSDDEVEGILRAVGPRQAADFLTNIPKDRAARLSRRMLVPQPLAQERPT